jgi:NADH dehydrogenase
VVLNAIGPETFTFRELVQAIARALGKSRPLVSVSPGFGFLAASLLGWLVRDVVITREEIQGLMAGLLYVDTPPTGSTRLTDWARMHAEKLGRKYASELARRSDRVTGYEGL